MPKFYDYVACQRKADQHWEMAGLARQDGDHNDAAEQTKKAKLWEERAINGGYYDDKR